MIRLVAAVPFSCLALGLETPIVREKRING